MLTTVRPRSITTVRPRSILLGLWAALGLLPATCAGQALGATFTVNSTADTTECAATCTLRGAIAAADASADASNTVLVAAGTYQFGPALKSEPTGTGELRVANPPGSTLTIVGAGAASTVIDAGQGDRVMQISGSGKDVLEGLALQKGFQHEDEAFTEEDVRGAGILQLGGELTLSHMRLTNDRNNGWGGGVDVRDHGKLTIENSEIDHDWTSVGGGGGIALEPGTLIATNTTIDNDTSAAGQGGGMQVMSGSQATLSNVTIANNGILEIGLTYEGGGLYVEGGTVDMTNVTFAGDLAGGAFNGGSDISAQESSHLAFKNVLLGKRPEEEAGQYDCNGAEVGNVAGWIDEGGNLAADTSCDLASPADMGLDLKLGELGANGGSTPTVPLLQGSPAIDFGVTGCPTTDQREDPRIGNCDSGAFEFGSPPPSGGEPDGGTPGGTTPEAKTTPTTGGGVEPISSPAPAIASTPQAIEKVLLGCGNRALTLSDVLIAGGRVHLSGSAAKSLVGKRVKILFDGSKQVAGATVGANGQFATTAPLPPARLRDSNSARYIAVSGKQRSLNLKLTRRLLLQPPIFSAGKVTLVGQVVAPLTKPASSVTVEQQLQCGKSAKVLTFTPSASGRFHVTLTGVPASAKAGLYRLSTSVLGSPGSHQAFRTYSLPLPVPFA